MDAHDQVGETSVKHAIMEEAEEVEEDEADATLPKRVITCRLSEASEAEGSEEVCTRTKTRSKPTVV